MRELKDLTVVLTACNGLISPSQIAGLKSVTERNIRIIGTDAQTQGAGSKLVDDFVQVPNGNDSTYTDSIYRICASEGVDAVLPASDLEVHSLSAEKDRFQEIGTTVVANNHSVVDRAGDKGKFLEYISAQGLPCAGYRIPKDISAFRTACHELGYPDHPVVMKPRFARGNRGMRIIKSDINKGDLLLNEKPGQPYTTLEHAAEALTSPGLDSFPSLVVMEYLPGTEYSVDVLAEEGNPLIMVPKRRVETAPGLSVIGEVDLNRTVIEAVADICTTFGFKYNVNIQLRKGRDGCLYPYEVNPRIAASIDACRHAGANLLYYGIKLAIGEEIPEVSLTDGLRMIRYYEAHYTKTDESPGHPVSQ